MGMCVWLVYMYIVQVHGSTNTGHKSIEDQIKDITIIFKMSICYYSPIEYWALTYAFSVSVSELKLEFNGSRMDIYEGQARFRVGSVMVYGIMENCFRKTWVSFTYLY